MTGWLRWVLARLVGVDHMAPRLTAAARSGGRCDSRAALCVLCGGHGMERGGVGMRGPGRPWGALRLLERSRRPLLEHVIFFVGDQ